MLPFVNILIPAYKKTFLEQTLKSLLSQTYQNFCIYIIDDCSPFHLKTIIDSLSSNKLIYIRNEKNLGKKDLVANWNKALSYIDGDLIVLASDDDLYDANFLDTLVKLSLKYPSVDLFHCRVAVINDKNKPIYWGPSIAEYETDIDFIYQRSINRRTQLISDFMFRRRAIEKIGGFVSYPLAWYSDEMTLYKLAQGKGVVCAQETLFYWRSSLENISSKNDDTLQKADASFQHMEKMRLLIENLFPKNPKDIFLLSQLRSRFDIAIKRQLINDMIKSSHRINSKIFKKYHKYFTFREKTIFRIERFRRRLNF